MFWGSFRWGCIGPGTFFELEEKQKVNSTVYRDQILLGPLKDMWEESFGEVDPIVMEDGAPVHKKVCIPERAHLEMESLPHPPTSPDLNPIENVWHHIKEVVAKNHTTITSKDELRRTVLKIWNEFPQDKWNYLVESMPDRMKAVIKAKGGSTKW